ncbi:MAG: hypothetical protein KGL05_02200, partial [Acidobacteriota bacterium]|nr:hypothetical protein [Acidobacteriota bacterium]
MRPPRLVAAAAVAAAVIGAGVAAVDSGAATTAATTSNGTVTARATARTTGAAVIARLAPLARPANLTSFVVPAAAGEGVYRPAGRTVQGHSAIFTTTLRPLDNPTTVAGVAWIDPRLLSARLYSGSLSPGGLFWKYTAPVSRAAS